MLTPSQEPYKFGAWSVTVNLPVIPISSALLSNGNIIAWSSNEPNTFEGDIGHEPSRTLATLFNPITGQVSPLLDTGLAADMFCPGLAYLPDGRILVNGGSSSYHTAIYDPFLAACRT
jgi:galactose oxidase